MRSGLLLAWSVVLLASHYLHTSASAFTNSQLLILRGRSKSEVSNEVPSLSFVDQDSAESQEKLVLAFKYYDNKSLPSWTTELFEKCQTIETHKVNPTNSPLIDSILQGLNSPAPQSFYVLHRAVSRVLEVLEQEQQGSKMNSTQTNHHALELLQTTSYFLVKRGNKLVLKNSGDETTDKVGDSILWKIVPASDDLTDNANWHDIIPKSQGKQKQSKPMSTLQIATQILELVTEASERQVPLSSRAPIDELVDQVLEQLSWTMGMDLGGRTSADAAFVFALAGVRNEQLFQALAIVSTYEMMRVGQRNKFYSKYVLQIIEKHAAAGSKGPAIETLYRVAAECLIQKGDHSDLANNILSRHNSTESSSAPPLNLLSPRPLLWLWRFSARQRKAKTSSNIKSDDTDPSETGATEEDMEEYAYSRDNRPPPTLPIFADPDMPLIVDLGCGMGTSLLGLATSKTRTSIDSMLGIESFQACNLLGADLSQLAMGFGQGIADRWGLSDRLQYSWTTAGECLEMVEKSYQGQVALIMIQFPTPYRLMTGSNTGLGNTQLPTDFRSGFMVSDELLSQVARILSQSPGCKLLVQSNCEDVAVTIRQRATAQHGMKCLDVLHEVTNIDQKEQTQTRRNTEWITMGGERAIGPGWSSSPLLPKTGSTETEVACDLQGTPIHRCLLSCSHKSDAYAASRIWERSLYFSRPYTTKVWK